MAGVNDVRRDTVEASLVLVYTKMVELGFECDGFNVIPPIEHSETA